jgi:hypothetical protein
MTIIKIMGAAITNFPLEVRDEIFLTFILLRFTNMKLRTLIENFFSNSKTLLKPLGELTGL